MASTTYISIDVSMNDNGLTFLLPITNFNGTIDWGDGNIEILSIIDPPTHIYSNLGKYVILLNDINSTGLDMTYGIFNQPNYSNYITAFRYLNKINNLTSFANAFRTCNNLQTLEFALPDFTDNVTNMSQMFLGNTTFNQPITFNTSNVTNMVSMFESCTSFNQPITFDTTNVNDMNNLLYNCTSLNQPISLNCISCINLSNFIRESTSFDNSFTLINTSNVTIMSNMFNGCTSFNKPISLDCSSCVNIAGFLFNCTNFNSSLNLINTHNIRVMNEMFMYCSSFNQPLSLDCSSCQQMIFFLYEASSFNNSLNLTPINSLTHAIYMLDGTAMSPMNYSNLLILWGNQYLTTQSNVTLDATGLYYLPAATIPREYLTGIKNWTINDSGPYSNTGTINNETEMFEFLSSTELYTGTIVGNIQLTTDQILINETDQRKILLNGGDYIIYKE